MGAESLALAGIQVPGPVQLGGQQDLAKVVDQCAGDNRLDRLPGQPTRLCQVGQTYGNGDAMLYQLRLARLALHREQQGVAVFGQQAEQQVAVLRQLLGVDDAAQAQANELCIQIGGHPPQTPANAAAWQRMASNRRALHQRRALSKQGRGLQHARAVMAGARLFPLDFPHIQPQAPLLFSIDTDELAAEAQALPVRLVADVADPRTHRQPLPAGEVQYQQVELLRAIDAHRLIGRQLDQAAAEGKIRQPPEQRLLGAFRMQLDLDQHVAAQFGTEGTSTVQQVQPLRVGATELHPLRHIEALKHRQAGCAQHGAIHLTAEMKGVVALDAAGQLGHRGDIDHQPLAVLHVHEQHRMWLPRLRREQQ
ncbi:hypothetical protein D3C75_712630 [compost metagenome]